MVRRVDVTPNCDIVWQVRASYGELGELAGIQIELRISTL